MYQILIRRISNLIEWHHARNVRSHLASKLCVQNVMFKYTPTAHLGILTSTSQIQESNVSIWNRIKYQF